MFRRGSQKVSHGKRVLTVVLTVCVLLFATAAAAFADIVPPGGVTFTNKTEDCNGIIPTPGSENTVKTLTGGSLVPGGTAQYTIHFPQDPNNVGNWAIADCVLLGSGSDLKSYTVLDQGQFGLVNNAEDFTLTFHVDIPADAPIGARICNVAKTTESPSKSPGSNRKAGPACFTVGGDVRIEKHSAADPNGDLVPGATFVIWDCVNSADDPTLQPIVVTPAVSSGNIYSSTLAGGGVVHATGGFVAVSGPSGSTCKVTETDPPPGFQLPDTVTHSFTIPVGTSGATIINFVDPLAPGSIVITLSSGAALRGSPLSGGYAGAKAAIRWLTAYAAQESGREGLGIRFVSLLPQAFNFFVKLRPHFVHGFQDLLFAVRCCIGEPLLGTITFSYQCCPVSIHLRC